MMPVTSSTACPISPDASEPASARRAGTIAHRACVVTTGGTRAESGSPGSGAATRVVNDWCVGLVSSCAPLASRYGADAAGYERYGRTWTADVGGPSDVEPRRRRGLEYRRTITRYPPDESRHRKQVRAPHGRRRPALPRAGSGAQAARPRGAVPVHVRRAHEVDDGVFISCTVTHGSRESLSLPAQAARLRQGAVERGKRPRRCDASSTSFGPTSCTRTSCIPSSRSRRSSSLLARACRWSRRSTTSR